MKYEADYFCTAVRPEKDGTFRWVVFGYFDGGSRAGLEITSTAEYSSDAEAHMAATEWVHANLPNASVYGDAKYKSRQA